ALIARGAERITARDLDVATRELARWLSAELSVKAAGEAVTRLRDLLLAQPLSPALARALELARRYGWDERMGPALAGAPAGARGEGEGRAPGHTRRDARAGGRGGGAARCVPHRSRAPRLRAAGLDRRAARSRAPHAGRGRGTAPAARRLGEGARDRDRRAP